MLIILIRTFIIYCVVLFALRLMGKSELSKMSTFQMVVLFMIAELASTPIDSPTSSLLNGITAIITLLFVQVLFSFVSLKSEKFKNFINGKPSILIDHGKINVDEMARLRITINDLFEQLRIEDCPSPADVEFAIMESNGELSVLSKKEENILPLILICDGFLYVKNLARTKYSQMSFKRLLNKKKLSLEDIFLAYIDSSKKLHIYLMPLKGEALASEVII